MDKVRNFLSEAVQDQGALQSSSGPAISAPPPLKRLLAIQLPPITLHKFTGDLTTWTEFKDMFPSLVDFCTNLSETQKLHYLQTSLEGEASNFLMSVVVFEANYRSAWGNFKIGIRINEESHMLIYNPFTAYGKYCRIKQCAKPE
ncbi:hypothetical protein KM043_017649 [Ampulex compressa]|nr:hypothetical protein KM043_017649 [Ampulex compressa]